MKEIYKVKCPRCIIFGDPLYFENFTGTTLSQLVVNKKIPKRFNAARVVIEEVPSEYIPNKMRCFMTIYLSSDQTINTYLSGHMYSTQELFNKDIGVDSATYLLKIDNNYNYFYTNSNECLGNYTEFYHKINGKKNVDAVIIGISMSFGYHTIDNLRKYLNYFFKDIQRIDNLI